MDWHAPSKAGTSWCWKLVRKLSWMGFASADFSCDASDFSNAACITSSALDRNNARLCHLPAPTLKDPLPASASFAALLLSSALAVQPLGCVQAKEALLLAKAAVKPL